MKTYQKSMLAAVATLALWLAAFTAPASANGIIYTFDKDCCGVTSADTVTVSDIDPNEIRVTVSFADTPGIGLFSNAGKGGGQVLWFNINPSLLSGSGLSVLPASDFTLPTDFTLQTASSSNPFYPNGKGNSGFGSYDYVLDCSSICEMSKTDTQPLVFTVTYAGIGSSSDPFSTSGNITTGPYFVADVRNTGTGKTGRVAAFDPVDVPEPMTVLLFGTGLAGLAAMRRRKKA